MGSRRGPTECSRRCSLPRRGGSTRHTLRDCERAEIAPSRRRPVGRPATIARPGRPCGWRTAPDGSDTNGRASRELAIEGPHGKPQSAIRRGLARQSRDGRAGKSAPNGETLQATGSAHGIFRHRRVYADARHACLAHQLPRPPACLRARKVRTFFSERNCATPAVSHRWGSPH